MRTLIALMLLTLCSLTLAEDDPFDADLPIAFSLTWGNKVSHFRWEDQIFNFRACHNGTFVDQVDLSLALFSSGTGCLDDNWWLGISAQYAEEPTDNPIGLIGQYSKSPGMYGLFHHRSDFAELRIYIPLAQEIDDQFFYPWVELERARIFDAKMRIFGISTTSQLYAHGVIGLHRPATASVGISQRFGPLEFNARTDGAYSIGARYSTEF